MSTNDTTTQNQVSATAIGTKYSAIEALLEATEVSSEHACSYRAQLSHLRFPSLSEGYRGIEIVGHECTRTRSDGGLESCDRSTDFACQEAVCCTCLDLNYERYPDQSHVESDGLPSRSSAPRRSIWTRLLNLQLCSSAGCQKCIILLRGIQEHCKNLMTAFTKQTARKYVRISVRENGTVYVQISPFHLEFFSLSGVPSPFSAFGESNPKPLLPSLEYCYEFIQRNLQICTKSHPNCISSTNVLPKRVIDVGSGAESQHVILLETDSLPSKDASYIALSHCWGPVNTIPKTTKETYPQYLKRIPWTDLPRTYRDAIMLAQSCQIRYLWIDSLCIQQDSNLDWEIESANMAEIYAGAEFVLAASGASNSNVGCLFDRWACVFDRWTFPDGERKIPLNSVEIRTAIGGVQSSVFVRPVANAAHGDVTKFAGTKDTSAALPRRAWAFQERIVASRTVFFHNEELVWECRSTTACECRELNHLIEHELGTLKVMFTGTPVLLTKSHMRTYLDTWMETVETYSSLLITYESDRLPALAGLASRMSESTGSSYLAGIWENDLPRMLLWERKRHAGTFLRNSASKAPTWSWASVKPESPGLGGVLFKPLIFGFEDDARVIILEAECLPLGSNRFGTVSEGRLHIQVPLVQVTISIIGEEDVGICEVSFNGSKAPLTPDIISYEKALPMPRKYCAILLGRTTEVEILDYALVLQDVNDGVKYERVGVALVATRENWFNDAQLHRITLV